MFINSWVLISGRQVSGTEGQGSHKQMGKKPKLGPAFQAKDVRENLQRGESLDQQRRICKDIPTEK